MNDPDRIRTFGIFGHVGNGNLGDEAIIASVIQNIKHRYPDARIYGFTTNPDDTRERHKIASFPIRRTEKTSQAESYNGIERQETSRRPSKLAEWIKIKLKTIPWLHATLKGTQKCWGGLLGSVKELRFLIQCYRNLKGIDLLIIAGSQQLIDYVGGAWAFPYTLFKWSLLAKADKTKLAFVSVGVGPIQSSLGRFFVKNSLTQATYRSYRDETSLNLVKSLGVCGQNSVFPDLVYSLQIEALSSADSSCDLRRIVGINPVPFYDGKYWLGADACQYEGYIGKLAGFALWIIRRGYRILFFPTQLRLDPPVIRDIQRLMKNELGPDLEQKIVHKPIASFDDLVSAIDMTDMVVATRFHGIIIPYVLNKPVLGIAYQRKSTDLMEQMGQSEYVVDIHSFDAESLKARFVSMESRIQEIKEEIGRRNSVFRRALQDQYDRVLNLA